MVWDTHENFFDRTKFVDSKCQGLMIWNKTRNAEYKQLAAAVGQLLTCIRVQRNAVYLCRGSKDERLSDTEKVVTCLSY